MVRVSVNCKWQIFDLVLDPVPVFSQITIFANIFFFDTQEEISLASKYLEEVAIEYLFWKVDK